MARPKRYLEDMVEESLQNAEETSTTEASTGPQAGKDLNKAYIAVTDAQRALGYAETAMQSFGRANKNQTAMQGAKKLERALNDLNGVVKDVDFVRNSTRGITR